MLRVVVLAWSKRSRMSLRRDEKRRSTYEEEIDQGSIKRRNVFTITSYNLLKTSIRSVNVSKFCCNLDN